MTSRNQLTLGTATIRYEDGMWIVEFMRHTNFSIGFQRFGARDYAVAFCRERDLIVFA